jgi:type III pantothenate kinase
MRNESALSLGKVENAGIDRMLGTIGAMTKADPPVITVDCGTAVTVNAVDEDHHFLGGVVFAGISTQLFGLAKQTAAIPEMKYTPPTTHIGVNTVQCLMAGITASVVGGVQQTIDAFVAKTFKKKSAPIVVSGGESQQVVDALSDRGYNVIYHQHMVTDGILVLLAGAKNVDLQDAIIGKILS